MPPPDDSALLNVLVAYPYFGNRIAERLATMGAGRVRLLLDSGAFTSFKSGKPIALADYCHFIETLPVTPWRYFALDVIGDPVATGRNYQTMLDRGLRPVPIFTRGGHLDELDRYFETSEVVGLGGVAAADRASYAWVRAVMRHVGDRKVHILGFTAMDWLKFLRPYSVDSSSWNGFGRYGKLDVYVGRGKMAAVNRANAGAHLKRPDIQAAIRRLGADPGLLMDKAAWNGDRSACARLCAASWAACSADVSARLGTYLFLSVGTDLHCEVLQTARETLIAAGYPSMVRRQISA